MKIFLKKKLLDMRHNPIEIVINMKCNFVYFYKKDKYVNKNRQIFIKFCIYFSK